MIKHYQKSQLGKGDYGWLKTHYHFSFAEYYHPERMGLGALRVLNDDVIAPQSGFDMHPHRDMEIISVVHQGAISHHDSYGYQGKTKAHEVQVITAGSGIFHSEHNLEATPTHMYQIWIKPDRQGLTPTWAQASFIENEHEPLQLIVSGDGKAPLHINQKARIYLGHLEREDKLDIALDKYAYLVPMSGRLAINDRFIQAGDGVAITDESKLDVSALDKSQFLLISLGA